MINLAVLMPVWILSLSVFHYTIVLNRFHLSFDSLTPGVIQKHLSYRFTGQTLTFYIDPLTMQQGIEQFLISQWGSNGHPYHLAFEFYHRDQRTRCDHQCYGVKTSLTFELYYQDFHLARHYELKTL